MAGHAWHDSRMFVSWASAAVCCSSLCVLRDLRAHPIQTTFGCGRTPRWEFSRLEPQSRVLVAAFGTLRQLRAGWRGVERVAPNAMERRAPTFEFESAVVATIVPQPESEEHRGDEDAVDHGTGGEIEHAAISPRCRGPCNAEMLAVGRDGAAIRDLRHWRTRGGGKTEVIDIAVGASPNEPSRADRGTGHTSF